MNENEEETGRFLNLTEFIKQNKISEGAFGKVFVIVPKNQPDVKLVAKISKFSSKTNEKQKLNIKREITALSQLNHPYIVKFIGYSPYDFNHNMFPVIVTEYVPNGSLANIIKLERENRQPESWNDTKKLINIFGIASVMSYLHSNNLIHRDLKPDNVLEDDFLFPKIADFGLSKIIHTNTESITLDSIPDLKGTAPYIAPEVLVVCEYSKPCDVYSFAITCYEILTYEKPFLLDNSYKILNMAKEGYRPKFNKKVKKCYRKLVESCWAEDPSKRPTFDEIVHILKTDKKFLLKTVDKKEFFDYVHIVENKGKPINPTKIFPKVSFSRKNSLSKVDDSEFTPIFEELRIFKQFNNLPNSVQDIFDKTSTNQMFTISNQESIIIYANQSFDSKDFVVVLNYFANGVVFELEDDNQIFEQILNKLSSLYESDLKNIKVHLFLSKTEGINKIIQNKKVPILITINQSVTNIEPKSFYNCMSVFKITIPSSVNKIGEKAFYNCCSLDEIEIPSSVTKIGSYAFAKCSSLEKVQIPPTMKKIERFTFVKCESLNQIILPPSLEEIGGNAFCNCIMLEEITIPESVKIINSGAFSTCTSLKQINIPSLVTSIQDGTFSNCSSLIEIKIPSSIKKIEPAAFNSCKSLKKIIFEENSSLSSIEDSAFGICSSLEEITIPHSVRSISRFCFNGCIKLKRITIPSLKLVEESCFNGCISLEHLIIPFPASSIQKNAFFNCTNLNQVYIPQSVTSINFSSFCLCSSLVELMIPDSVISIEPYALYKCTSLMKLNIPSSVKEIGKNALNECSKLVDLEFNASVTKIEDSLFEECSSLKEISIPSCVKEIGKFAFQGCSSLEKINFCSPPSLVLIDDYAFCKCSLLNNVSIPPSVKRIGFFTFKNCDSLNDIVFPYLMVNRKYLSLNENTRIKRKYSFK